MLPDVPLCVFFLLDIIIQYTRGTCGVRSFKVTKKTPGCFHLGAFGLSLA